MAKVTYTKAQLMAFTVKEMKTLDLFSKINPKGLDKKGIVSAMIKAQKAEQKAIKKAESEIKKEVSPSKEAPVETKEDVSKNDVKKAKDVDVAEKSEKPVFHRPRKIRRNPMGF
jgi:hypothetical protein